MLCLGIDIGLMSHFVTFTSDALVETYKKTERCPRVEIPNTADGLDKLEALIHQYGGMDSCCALIEPTGHYGAALLQRLKSLKVQVFLAQSREKKEQQNKSDVEDSLKMAKLLHNAIVKKAEQVDNHYRVSPLVIPTPTAQLLHGYVDDYVSLNKDIVRRKNRLKAIRTELFPESLGFFDDEACPSALSLWQAFPTPQAIASASLDALAATRKARSKYPCNESFQQLQEAARTSIGQKEPIRVKELTFRQNQLIEQLLPMLRSKNELIKAIRPIVEQSREGMILTSFIGIDIVSAAIIIDRIKDVEAFASAGKFKSYFGWVPRQRQSGKSLDVVALSRGGNRDLKRTMRNVAMTAVVRDPSWKILYERLKKTKTWRNARTGKQVGKMKALGRIAGQMIGIIYVLLKQDRRLVQEHEKWGVLPPPVLYDPERHIVQQCGAVQASTASDSRKAS